MKNNLFNHSIKYIHNSYNFNIGGASAESSCNIITHDISKGCYNTISMECGEIIARTVFRNSDMQDNYICSVSYDNSYSTQYLTIKQKCLGGYLKSTDKITFRCSSSCASCPTPPKEPLTCKAYNKAPTPMQSYCATSAFCFNCKYPCTTKDDCSGLSNSPHQCIGIAAPGNSCSSGCPTPPPSKDMCIDLVERNQFQNYNECITLKCKPVQGFNKCNTSGTYLQTCSSEYVKKILGKVFDDPSKDCIDLSYMCAYGTNRGKEKLYIVIRIDDMGLQDYEGNNDYYKTKEILEWSENYKVPINIGIMGQNFFDGSEGGVNGFKGNENFRKNSSVWKLYIDKSYNIVKKNKQIKNDSLLPKQEEIWEFFNHSLIHSQQQTCPEWANDPSLNPQIHGTKYKGPVCANPDTKYGKFDNSCQCSWQHPNYYLENKRLIDISKQHNRIIVGILEASLNASVTTFVPPLNLIDPSSIELIAKLHYKTISLADTSQSKPCKKITEPNIITAPECISTTDNTIKQNNIEYNLFGAHANSANTYFSNVPVGLPVNTILQNDVLKTNCYKTSISQNEQQDIENMYLNGNIHLHNNIDKKSNPNYNNENYDDYICPLKITEVSSHSNNTIKYSVMMFHAFSKFLRPSEKDNDKCTSNLCYFNYYNWLEAFYHAAQSHDYYDISFVTFSKLNELVTDKKSLLQKQYLGNKHYTIIYNNDETLVSKKHILPECFTNFYHIFKDHNLKSVLIGKRPSSSFTTTICGETLIYNIIK